MFELLEGNGKKCKAKELELLFMLKLVICVKIFCSSIYFYFFSCYFLTVSILARIGFGQIFLAFDLSFSFFNVSILASSHCSLDLVGQLMYW